MNFPKSYLFAILAGVSCVTIPVLTLLLIGISTAHGKSTYELVKDLFLPLVSPLVAVLIPVIVLFIIPYGQSRQKLSMELCGLYFSEEMRDSRNQGWRFFVTEQRQLSPIRRAERLNHYIDYLSDPETHRSIDPDMDVIYQKLSRVLDFFAIVNGCLQRGTADEDIVRDFLLFYYLWWRDEIMIPLRKTQRIQTNDPKIKPVWWDPMPELDALAISK
jgi:hypothetical protein